MKRLVLIGLVLSGLVLPGLVYAVDDTGLQFITPCTAIPSPLTNQLLCWDTGAAILYYWNGAAYVPLTGAAAAVTSITGTANQITANVPVGPVTLSLAGPHNFTTQTLNALLLGAGASPVTAMGSLGTTTTLLHGNAAGAPTFGAVVSADLNITTTTCTNQFVSALSSGAVGTCTTATLASAQFANQGSTTTVLHGNAAGNPSFGAIVSADLNLTTSTCTNQFVTAISASAAGTCTTATLASAQFSNQGTTTTVLHGNAAGNPSFGAVANADLANSTITVAAGSGISIAGSPVALGGTVTVTATGTSGFPIELGYGASLQ